MGTVFVKGSLPPSSTQDTSCAEEDVDAGPFAVAYAEHMGVLEGENAVTKDDHALVELALENQTHVLHATGRVSIAVSPNRIVIRPRESV